MFILYGKGDNGKTVFLSILRELLQQYSVLLAIENLMTRQMDNNSNADLADLCGARLVCTTETEEGQRFAEGRLKRICQGMGTIKAVRKYENPFEFPETHKLWLDCNYLPASTASGSLMNRLRIVPWEVTIPKSEQDPELRSKLLAEAEGILAWIMSGAVDWYSHRLPTPDEVDQAAASYQQQQDKLADWLEECCVTGNGFESRAQALFDSYKQFSERNGERNILDMKKFRVAMLAKNFQEDRKKLGVYWNDISLKKGQYPQCKV